MKLKQGEINAIVQAILKGCENEKEFAEKEFKKKLKEDPRFLELARLMKTAFSGEFQFLLSVWQTDLDQSDVKLANILRESYFKEHYEENRTIFKSDNQIAGEVIIAAPHHNSYDSIIAAIDPKKQKQED